MKGPLPPPCNCELLRGACSIIVDIECCFPGAGTTGGEAQIEGAPRPCRQTRAAIVVADAEVTGVRPGNWRARYVQNGVAQIRKRGCLRSVGRSKVEPRWREADIGLTSSQADHRRTQTAAARWDDGAGAKERADAAWLKRELQAARAARRDRI